ncbi:MAG: flagellar M-ring protein FliF [Acidobacteria bacterium]|jgi:flagellar M-ring protein FliF|nr:MAG: flagellar M-ring protein FliF [Acidobacteriota bacterium]
MADLRETLNNLKERFLALSTTQKLTLIGAPLIAVSLLLALVVFVAKPSYTTLYAGLSQEDMSAVMAELDREGVSYKVGQDGRSILVQDNQARDLRLKLAAKGIPSKGIVGYELFDKTSIGISEFQNQVNYKRAIEGELARTIMRMAGVEDVKVNIGMPEKSIFVREEEEPRASVFVKLKPGYELTLEQVKAIRNLVSASVPKLKTKNVVVVDHMGRDLTAMLDDDSEFIRDKELKLKVEFEKRLEKDIQRALEEALGYGSVKVKVSADIDFTKREQKEEIYDPDMTAVVSQQKKKERTFGVDVGGVPGAQANVPPGTGAMAGAPAQLTSEKSETITNYEVSKKEVYTAEPILKIRRLSVGIMVDNSLKNLDIEKVKRIASASAGIDPQRGDVITVEAMPFHKPVFEKPPVYIEYIKLALIALVALVLLATLIVFLKRLLAKREVGVSAPAPVSVVPPTEMIEGVEELRVKAEKIEAMETIQKVAKQEPQKVAKIIRGWLKDKGY